MDRELLQQALAAAGVLSGDPVANLIEGAFEQSENEEEFWNEMESLIGCFKRAQATISIGPVKG